MNLDTDYLESISLRQKRLYYETVLDNKYIKYKPYIRQSIPLLYCLEREHNDEVHSLLLGGSGYLAGKHLLAVC